MSESKNIIGRKTMIRTILGCGILVAIVSGTGCQVELGGQTLPSPYYMQDDVQYFPPGPEFKLAREAAAMEDYARENEAK